MQLCTRASLGAPANAAGERKHGQLLMSRSRIMQDFGGASPVQPAWVQHKAEAAAVEATWLAYTTPTTGRPLDQLLQAADAWSMTRQGFVAALCRLPSDARNLGIDHEPQELQSLAVHL